jgi:hypothetical protein
MAEIEATNVKPGTITSSPGPTPMPRSVTKSPLEPPPWSPRP